LKEFYQTLTGEGKTHEDIQVAKIVLRSVSESIIASMHFAINPESPHQSISSSLMGGSSNLSSVLITVLNGGKEFNSKVKVQRVYLVLEIKKKDPIMAFLKKIKAAVLKCI